MITAPYHGKSLVDALAGVDKAVLRQKLTDAKGFDSATRDADGNIVEQAVVCADELSAESRRHGLVVDTKHKRRPDQAKVDLRQYKVSNYTKEEPIPFKDCTFKAHPSQFGSEPKSGLAEHYQFQFHPDLPLNTCALRRIPCLCLPCKAQMKTPWDYGKPAEEQARFKTPQNCIRAPLMDGLNEWKLINVDLVTDSNKARKQVNKILQLMLDRHVERMYEAIWSTGLVPSAALTTPKSSGWCSGWEQLTNLSIQQYSKGAVKQQCQWVPGYAKGSITTKSSMPQVGMRRNVGTHSPFGCSMLWTQVLKLNGTAARTNLLRPPTRPTTREQPHPV